MWECTLPLPTMTGTHYSYLAFSSWDFSGDMWCTCLGTSHNCDHGMAGNRQLWLSAPALTTSEQFYSASLLTASTDCFLSPIVPPPFPRTCSSPELSLPMQHPLQFGYHPGSASSSGCTCCRPCLRDAWILQLLLLYVSRFYTWWNVLSRAWFHFLLQQLGSISEGLERHGQRASFPQLHIHVADTTLSCMFEKIKLYNNFHLYYLQPESNWSILSD